MERLDCCNVGIFDLGCELVGQCEQHLQRHDAAEVAASIDAALHRLLVDTGLPLERILAVGVSSPGVVDAETGTVIRAANMGWQDVPLRSVLEAAIKLPVFVDNETNLSALGEYRYGKLSGQC